MPTPFPFLGHDIVLGKPRDWDDSNGECVGLPVHRTPDGTTCVSCWRPTFLERLKLLFGGDIWLHVLSGRSQPPVTIVIGHRAKGSS